MNPTIVLCSSVMARDDRALTHRQVRDGVEGPESLRRLVEAPGAGSIPAAELDVLDRDLAIGPL